MSKIILLTVGTSMVSEYVVSLVNTMNHFRQLNVDFIFGNGQGALVSRARQVCYEQARQKDFDRLVWVDSDISWQATDFVRLLSTEHDILTGAYLDELGRVVATRLDGDRVSREQLDGQEPFEIAWCGFGFVCLSKDVVAALPEPFIRDGEYGEDVSFCMNARDIGFRVFLDPTIKVTHHKSIAFSP